MTCIRGAMGVPIVYVVRHQLIPENKDGDPPFGDEDTNYTSIDQEMIARTPILTNDANYTKEYETLKTNGPFIPAFLTDLKKVWAILHQCFGTSSTWQQVKKFTAQQNGHQVWHTLHNHVFGGNIINIMYSNIHLTLKSLHCSGNCKNFKFNMYCTTHVEQHIRHAALTEFNMAPLEESMKIYYFEDGITDSSFSSVKSTIMVDRQKFQEFDTVMQLYVNFKHS
jgi:hypothetical protein